ncbi:glutamate-cysteine ligase family protein [Georgenia sp. TF02-10]|uniref:glutamate-cysteine ligase family protein n=1 Tax=Georgenia sp. TF02-10 TaxID=2917725 RepID=UPI001FA709B1|nr:glutamate-cysteine ligase family protein [Georgenia sp. TF02-10]UNX53646.1 glutamate-cysteine ligase family protein [Georgenia sp. TF02-10]
MGKDVAARRYTRADHTHYRAAVQRCLDALERMLDSGAFVEDEWRTGLEIELNLVQEDLSPAMSNAEVLAHIDDLRYQTEIGRFNIELNVEPRRIDGQSLIQLESVLRRNLNQARDRAGDLGAGIVAVGILPTLPRPEPGESWFSDNPRYHLLDEAILAARREDVTLDIPGPERLQMTTNTIAVEAACTSVQLHLQVRPGSFARYWNAAQVLAGPQLALGANSPYLFGHRLMAETRTELFLQATDFRPPELRNQGVRPLVPFGDRWINSIFDLFEENVRYYPALLPEVSDEDPLAVLDAGGTPSLAELRLHNGTIYRWNRPVYDVTDGQPHLRVENRVLPSGPTVVDVVANAAFFYGAAVEMVVDERPLWSRMSFEAARENFHAGARNGAEARLYWPGEGHIDWDELVLRTLLPMAQRGLERLGVASEAQDRYLGVVESRAKLRRNGASWQVAATEAFEARGMDRPAALRAMLREYIGHMHANEPVHTWPVP